MRHRVSGRSRPLVDSEPLMPLHGVIVVHARRFGVPKNGQIMAKNGIMARETRASEG